MVATLLHFKQSSISQKKIEKFEQMNFIVLPKFKKIPISVSPQTVLYLDCYAGLAFKFGLWLGAWTDVMITNYSIDVKVNDGLW